MCYHIVLIYILYSTVQKSQFLQLFFKVAFSTSVYLYLTIFRRLIFSFVCYWPNNQYKHKKGA